MLALETWLIKVNVITVNSVQLVYDCVTSLPGIYGSDKKQVKTPGRNLYSCILCVLKVKSHSGAGFCWTPALLRVFLLEFVIKMETSLFLPLKNVSKELPELRDSLE